MNHTSLLKIEKEFNKNNYSTLNYDMRGVGESSVPTELKKYELKDHVKDLQKIAPEADAILMFSCFARLFAFGPLMEDEVKGINKLWDAPQIGFFSGGEIGSALNEELVFQNEACCVVTLKEK